MAERINNPEFIPQGEYIAQIVETKICNIGEDESKGRALNLIWQILDGDYKQRLIWQRLCLWAQGNGCSLAMESANRKFKEIREAARMPNLCDFSELIHTACKIQTCEDITEFGTYDPETVIRQISHYGAPSRSASADWANAAIKALRAQ